MSWDASLAAVDATVAGYFDTLPCTLMPMKKGVNVNAGPSVDPARLPFEFMATIEVSPKTIDMDASSGITPTSRQRHVAGQIVLTADVALWPWIVAKGDQIVQGLTRYSVTEIHRDGTTRIMLILSI